MLYGRRIPNSTRPASPSRFRSLIVNRPFQYKYIWYFTTALGGSALLFLVPSFFFLNQNYELFKRLAFDTQPLLLGHLERELVWLSCFMFASIACILGVTFFLSVRMTKNLLLPLLKMEKHMHQLMLGHWEIADFELEEQDDFRELSMTYDYLYRTLKATTENDLKQLERLQIAPENREAYAIWNRLMTEKRNRLGLTLESQLTPENVVNLREFDQKRRAS